VTPVPALDLTPRLRDANLADVGAIVGLIHRYASVGQMLPKTPGQVLRSLRQFAVMESAGCVVACGGLRVYSSSLAEVVSLAVDEDWQGRGLGAEIVAHLLRRAECMGVGNVFAMTLTEPFFRRQGFHPVPRASLPEKEAADCRSCARAATCREVAVVRKLAPLAASSATSLAGGACDLPNPLGTGGRVQDLPIHPGL
jgi:N-acetylglutamate synthase-like GNAT family acetyltransferase